MRLPGRGVSLDVFQELQRGQEENLREAAGKPDLAKLCKAQ